MNVNMKSTSSSALYAVHFMMSLILILFVANRLGLNTSDTSAYIEFYNDIQDFESGLIRFEPGFTLIALSLRSFFENSSVFLLAVAFIGVGLKLIAIRNYSNYYYLSLIVYLSKYILLQDMIQVRAGVASAIFLCSIKYLYNRSAIKYIAAITVAAMFHYSALIYFAFYFISDRRIKINSLIAYFALLLLFEKMFNLKWLFFAFGAEYFDKVFIYMQELESGKAYETSVMSNELILYFMVIVVLYKNRRKLIAIDLHFGIWLKSLITSLFLLLFFVDFPVVALRFSELFGVSSIFIFPFLIKSFSNKYVGFIVFFCTVSAYYYNYYYKTGMIYLS